MVDMARRRFPYLPSSLLLNHRFESIRKIGRVDCPVLLGHGGDDQVVPPRMSARLAAAVRPGVPVTSFIVPGAGHSDFYQVGEAQVLAAMRAFLARIEPTSAAA
jgi:fermentation-respiration switch protein FrsA (DUF1100 family)